MIKILCRSNKSWMIVMRIKNDPLRSSGRVSTFKLRESSCGQQRTSTKLSRHCYVSVLSLHAGLSIVLSVTLRTIASFVVEVFSYEEKNN